MELLPLNNDELVSIAAGWLAEKRNYQWLDFGNGVQQLSAVALKIMAQKDNHVLRVFTSDDDRPIGIVGLGNVDRTFKIATLWAALGEKGYARKGYAIRAITEIMTYGFGELGLGVINAWFVEGNPASPHIVEHFNFKPIGRQRRCHYIDGRAYDRLWFDLLASEYNPHREAA